MYGQAGKILWVPNPENFTPIRSIRIAAATWDVAKERARAEGKTMSELVRELLDWWLRVPGAKLPARPDPRRLTGADIADEVQIKSVDRYADDV
jgi:hypothetical protein